MHGSLDRELFIPAESEREAASRIFALTGRAPARTRGPKRAIVALADALGVEIDIEATNGIAGQQLADRLDIAWPEAAATATTQISLYGLNLLLEAAAEAFRAGALRPPSSLPDTLAGWSDFQPARSKIEAVNRISALTHSGPETLGPGSKERRSVFANLAANLFPSLDSSLSKTDLGAALASELGVPWTSDCYSTGYTISLVGLNTVLAGAERHLGLLGRAQGSTFATATEEGNALVAALAERIPTRWDGRACVNEMRKAAYSQWRQMEWPGFYLEFVGLPTLNDAFPMPETGGPQRRFGQTTFDYALGRVWDLKVHTSRKLFYPSRKEQKSPSRVILNDARAARACVEEQGLGFLILSGISEYDETGTFDRWHRGVTATGVSRVRSNSGRNRARKQAFQPTRIDAFWIASVPEFDAAIASGHLAVKPVGRQPVQVGQLEGSARAEKWQMKATDDSPLHFGSHTWAVRLEDG